jgi:hypothetical protein
MVEIAVRNTGAVPKPAFCLINRAFMNAEFTRWGGECACILWNFNENRN